MKEDIEKILLKEDAKQLTDARKEAYIYKTTIIFLNDCFVEIRKSANNAEYFTSCKVHSNSFAEEIYDQAEIVLGLSGYKTERKKNSKKLTYKLNISWEE